MWFPGYSHFCLADYKLQGSSPPSHPPPPQVQLFPRTAHKTQKTLTFTSLLWKPQLRSSHMGKDAQGQVWRVGAQLSCPLWVFSLLGFWCGHQPGSPPGSLVRVFSGGSWPRQDWRNHWPWWLNSVSHPSSLNGVEGMGLKVVTLQSLDWSPDGFFWRPTPIQKFCRSQPPTPTSLI